MSGYDWPANWPFGHLAPLSYHLLLVDCPWPWKTYSDKGATRSPSAHYQTMTLDEIAALPMLDLARTPTLLMAWGTMPMLGQQIEIIQRWGFSYQTTMIWHKVFPSGKDAIGLGHRVRSMAEPLILATLGKPKHKPFPGLFRGVRREHSRKPDELHDLIELCAPDLWPRAELFARESRPNWVTWGDEATKFDAECA